MQTKKDMEMNDSLSIIFFLITSLSNVPVSPTSIHGCLGTTSWLGVGVGVGLLTCFSVGEDSRLCAFPNVTKMSESLLNALFSVQPYIRSSSSLIGERAFMHDCIASVSSSSVTRAAEKTGIILPSGVTLTSET